MEKAEAHALKGSQEGVEVMGLLVGNFYSHEGREWVMVEDYVTAKNAASSVSVKFSEGSFSALSSSLFPAVSANMVVVGWMHSHPGLDCFLSYVDIDTQQKYFDHPLAVAAVSDPQKTEDGHPKRRVYRLTGEGDKYAEISYAVIG